MRFERTGRAATPGLLVLVLLTACTTPPAAHQPPARDAAPSRTAQSEMGDMPGMTHDDVPVQPVQTDAQGMKDMKGMRPGDAMAEPFFTHMGVPMPKGVGSVQLGATASRDKGHTVGDGTVRAMAGLTDSLGIVLQSDGVVHDEHAEAMFQYAVVRSDDRRCGIAPLIEFETPTHAGGDRRTHTLVGFSTALGNSDVSFNQAIHFDVNNPNFEGSASLTARWCAGVFPIAEVIAEGGRGEKPVVNVLGGMKFRVADNLMLGIALEKPVTDRRDFTSRLMLTLDIAW